MFEWSSVAGADNYQLQVATTVTFSGVSLVYNQLGITNTYQQVPALNANTQYYWRVKSFNGAIAGYLSTRCTFETGIATGILSAQEEYGITSIYSNHDPQKLK